MKSTSIAIVFILCAALSGPVRAADAGGFDAGHNIPCKSPFCPYPLAVAADTDAGHRPDVPAKWGAAEDAAFLSAMIAHHAGAVEMAEPLAGKTSDPDVDRWAKAIIETQRKEIEAMRALQKTLGRVDPEASEAMAGEMQAMLTNRADENPEVNFVMIMIPHHAEAIGMSMPVLLMSDNPALRKLARDIVTAQTAEIYDFRDWLAKRGK